MIQPKEINSTSHQTQHAMKTPLKPFVEWQNMTIACSVLEGRVRLNKLSIACKWKAYPTNFETTLFYYNYNISSVLGNYNL